MYPQSNPFRQVNDLSGYWDFAFDPDEAGERAGWPTGFAGGAVIAVPGSWNEQIAGGRDNLGPAWYQRRFDLPWGWEGQHILLRFGSVNYLADAWLNGRPLDRHEGGHLPFTFDVTGLVRPQGNRLVVRVDGRLAPDRVPPGDAPLDPLDTFPAARYPAGSFDFFPYCGIHRPVLLYTEPVTGLRDVAVTTGFEGATGIVRVAVRTDAAGGVVRATLDGFGATVAAEAPTGPAAEVILRVPDVVPWAPGAPALYDLTVELREGHAPRDRYILKVSVRTVQAQGDSLLLNGRPMLLRGFGRHEDFPIVGRRLPAPVVVADYELLRWVGANSFRTSHYPYAEEIMDLADRLGFLVIDETPAVGLFFAEDGLERRLALCRQYVAELIARDRNHPSVILWSVANEPHSHRPAATGFFRELYDLAKTLDPTRPVTLASHIGLAEEAFDFMDVICLNRYNGWKSELAQLDLGCERLAEELDRIHARYPKPLILTEFGADALPGCYAHPPELFTEEYQAEMIERFVRLLAAKPYVAGMHAWALCDFKTAQDIRRVGGINYKGVFTRDRRPKQAAYWLRQLWGGATADAGEQP